MISQRLQEILASTGKHYWLEKGSKLSVHYKALLAEAGFSSSVYTKILFKNRDLTISRLRQLCTLLEIDIKSVV